MTGHLYIAPGDITRLAADAIAFSASTHLSESGTLYSSFREHVPGFAAWYRELRARHAPVAKVGTAFAMPLYADRKPHFVVAHFRHDAQRQADEPAECERQHGQDAAGDG